MPTTFSHLEELNCDFTSVAKLLFQYVAIQRPQRKKLRADFKALRKDVGRASRRLSECANEVEEVTSRNLYGKQTMLLTHKLLQNSHDKNECDFENLPLILRRNAAYMRLLFQLYLRFAAVYEFGPEHLLLAVQKHLKSCAGKQSIDDDLADLLQAAYEVVGMNKKVDSQSLAKRLRRLKEPYKRLTAAGLTREDLNSLISPDGSFGQNGG
jgi:hypothetical protein